MNTKTTLYARDHFEAAPKNARYKAVLARSGIQTYLSSELGIVSSPDEMISIYRPEQELFSPSTMKSFEKAPVTINHPSQLVHSTSASSAAVEVVGYVYNIKREGQFLIGHIVLHDPHAMALIHSGKNKLSIGYTFTLEESEGVDEEGVSYSGIQRNIVGDHVAIVEQGRCGCHCRIDQETPGALHGAENNKSDAILSILEDIRASVSKKTPTASIPQEQYAGDAMIRQLVRPQASCIKASQGRELFISRTFYTH